MKSNQKYFKGIFTYQLVDENGKSRDICVPFELTATLINGELKGTRIDDETKHLMNEPIQVNGFIRGDFIHFHVGYPFNYFNDDETGEIIPEENESHPGVNYQGWFNRESESYEGDWQIIVDEERWGNFQDDYIEGTLNGSWEMKEIDT